MNGVAKEVEKLLGLDNIRPRLHALNCPLCESEQVQVCMDSNNPQKDFAKCRECGCSAPLKAWNEYKSKR